MKRFQVLILIVLLALFSACSKKQPAVPELTVMTHDSFDVSAELVQSFERQQGVKVRFLKAGDAGAALNQAVLAGKNPLADVFFGVDNTFLSRALEADIFEPYESPQLKNIPASFQLDPSHRLLPVDFGDVCLNYDRAWFASRKLEPPRDIADLVKPAYKGLTVVENPATSSPGLAFVLATVGRFGEDGWLDYWKQLRANDVLVTDGWENAYWGQFSAASEGQRPIVVSYASSPAAEIVYAEKPPAEAPTAAVLGAGSAFRQVEFVGILKGTKQPELARAWVDYMLGTAFQQDIPMKMFVYPVNSAAALPEVFVKYARTTESPATVAPARIDEKRQAWIEAWTQTVLR